MAPEDTDVDRDEFALLAQNAAEAGVADRPLPPVRRITASTPNGRVSALQWGDGPPDLVLIHGGGQNAHTWDTVLLGLGRPALAVDLPGHGHSDWRADHDHSPAHNAEAVAAALADWDVAGVPVVGMSLGGLTTIVLAARYPGVASRTVLVDVTPSVMARVEKMNDQQRGTTALTAGPAVFDDLDAMVAAAVATAPSRSPESMRRGVLHNSRPLPDGRRAWRWDPERPAVSAAAPMTALWDDVDAIDVPITLVRGGNSAFVGDDDVAEFRTHKPGLSVEVVAGAGHSVQSDRPRELVVLLQGVFTP